MVYLPERPEISELQTFADISGHPERVSELEWASRSRLGRDSLLLEGFLLINHHVASVALLDLSTSNRMLNGTIDMVEKCFTSWQGGSVSGWRDCIESPGQPQGLPLRDNTTLRATADIWDASDRQLKDPGFTAERMSFSKMVY